MDRGSVVPGFESASDHAPPDLVCSKLRGVVARILRRRHVGWRPLDRVQRGHDGPRDPQRVLDGVPGTPCSAAELVALRSGRYVPLFGTGVERAEVFQECGHSLALEAPERLAATLREFMLGRG